MSVFDRQDGTAAVGWGCWSWGHTCDQDSHSSRPEVVHSGRDAAKERGFGVIRVMQKSAQAFMGSRGQLLIHIWVGRTDF